MPDTFRAFVADEKDGKYAADFRDLTAADLPPYPVLVDVAYSTLNYKDGLAVTGKGKIVRKPPLVCGIDLAGTVAESQDPAFKPGDAVLVNGWGLSETNRAAIPRASASSRNSSRASRKPSPPSKPWRSARRVSPRCCA